MMIMINNVNNDNNDIDNDNNNDKNDNDYQLSKLTPNPCIGCWRGWGTNSIHIFKLYLSSSLKAIPVPGNWICQQHIPIL